MHDRQLRRAIVFYLFQIAAQRDRPPFPVFFLEDLVYLVPVGQAVHEVVGKRFSGEVGSPLEQGIQLGAVQMARLRDTADVLLKRAAQQRLGHLPVRSGIPLLGEQIRCGLVFGDVIQIGIDFQPVERAANKQGL